MYVYTVDLCGCCSGRFQEATAASQQSAERQKPNLSPLSFGLKQQQQQQRQRGFTTKSPLHCVSMWRADSGLAPPAGTTLERAISSRAETGDHQKRLNIRYVCVCVCENVTLPLC